MSMGPAIVSSLGTTCNNGVRIKVSIRVMVSFTTGAVRSAILATAGLLVKNAYVDQIMHSVLLEMLEC